MFKRWYLSRMETELDQRVAQLTSAKTRAAAGTDGQRAEHEQLIAAADAKVRDLRRRLEELRTSQKEHYAELKANVELARESLAVALRSARRFA